MIDNLPDPLARIRRPDLLAGMLQWCCDTCGLGSIRDHRVSAVGYDDCNVIVRTDTGSYVVKIFTKSRSDEMSEYYVRVIEAVITAGVCHPPLLSAGGRNLLRHPTSGNLLIVMEFVVGASFLELAEHPDPSELRQLIEHVARVHSIGIPPRFVHDWWAIPNIAKLIEEIGPALEPTDRQLAQRAARRFAEVDIAALPHAFVHGDLTKANVMRRAGGGLAILDFAVANRYPRVHELAMIAVNLMHGDPEPASGRIAVLSRLYGEHSPLSDSELAALPAYIFAAAAMELLGATREWSVKGNRSYETRFLLDLGRSAIRETAC